MNMRKIVSSVAVFGVLVSLLPMAALASNGKAGLHGRALGLIKHDKENEDNDEDNDFEFRGQGALESLVTIGEVTAVGSNNFTMKAKNTPALTVLTNDAKIIRLPFTVISLSSIAVNDKVWVYGNNNGTQINALVVYEMQAGKKFATKNGQVTAVSGNTITVQTKHNGSVTVNIDSNTQFKKNGQNAVLADVKVGSKISAVGLWDKVANVLAAIKVRIK